MAHAHTLARSAILILGVPGSGKSALCRSISEQGHATWLSASSVLRDHSHRNPLITAAWRARWALGQNAPDEEVLPVLWDAYARCKGPVLLDGYPRTSVQLRDFFQRGGRLSTTVSLSVSDCTALSRIAGRSVAQDRLDDDIDVAKTRIEAERHRISELVRCPEIDSRISHINAELTQGDMVAETLAVLTTLER